SRLREMALEATSGSLVLLDEIGAATDPEEGGALGVAVVDHFRAAGAFTLASTHLLPLKVYGATTPGVVNASMGFDEETLQPTYEMRTGLPGKSAGLDIAMRLGMPATIMERARRSMGSREQDLARLLAELHARLDAAAQKEREMESARADLAAREKNLTADWDRRESARLAEIDRRSEEAIARFEAESRALLDELRDKKAAQRAARIKRELREPFAAPEEKPAARIEEGARVRLRGVREPARVRRVLSPDRIEVEAGALKMQVAPGDVIEVLPEPTLPKNVSFTPAPRLNPEVREINVIGQRAEEARDNVDRFLDSAVMATANRVRIVHGHGMGILRKAIWELLDESPHVEKFYAATQNEGGAGATIVELKE
ncbi:MAG: Smr/MutS family protein, partial [Bryobacteraceae bacterium]